MSDPQLLSKQISGFLPTQPMHKLKALIAPHAGFSYSGPTAGHAYSLVDPTAVDSVFLLGPSHHLFIKGIATSSFSIYETPCGDIPLDTDLISALNSTGMFSVMSNQTDCDEHSLELHLPFIHKIMGAKKFKLVPLLVGSITEKMEDTYANVLGSYFAMPNTLWIISSDFCHWGERFRYTPSPSSDPLSRRHTSSSSNASTSKTHLSPSNKTSSTVNHNIPIYEYISQLDHLGMDLITTRNRKDFRKYLTETGNTICGRNPIMGTFFLI